MAKLLALLVLVPLATAALCLVAGRRLVVRRVFAVIGAAMLLGAGLALVAQTDRDGYVVMQVGNWPAPYGITLIADRLSAMMVLVAGIIGSVVTLYVMGGNEPRWGEHGFYPLLNMLLAGVCGAFLAGDVFNLYIWFELMLIASFVMLVLGGSPGQLRGGIKYVALNLISSSLFLAAIGILYGLAGTLNMADLAVKLRNTPNTGLVTTVGMLFFVAFGVKAALFPLFFWLPASYHAPSAVVSAAFAGLLTKVGVYALFRVFTLLFTHDTDFTHGLIVAVSALTMLTGVLGAVAQTGFRKLLAFHIISQIGYMTLGLGLAGIAHNRALAAAALAASIYFIVHNTLAKANLFLIAGVAERLCGTSDLKELGSLYRTNPGLALLFAISAFALAGMPPLSGFFAKLALAKAGFAIGAYAAVTAALVTGLLTLYSMTKIWVKAFWEEAPEPAAGPPGGGAWGGGPAATAALAGPMIALATLTVALGLFAGPAFAFTTRAAEQLLNREAYIRAVLGGIP